MPRGGGWWRRRVRARSVRALMPCGDAGAACVAMAESGRRIKRKLMNKCRPRMLLRTPRAQVLTLKCPRCSQAFVDFQNCFALTCGRCGCGFCAWCLRDCGDDAHRHVANCPENLEGGRVYSTEAKFKVRAMLCRVCIVVLGNTSAHSAHVRKQRALGAAKCKHR